MKRELAETGMVRADKHCVSCLYWNGVECSIFRKRKEGTGQCSRRRWEYRTHPAFLVKKKSWE